MGRTYRLYEALPVIVFVVLGVPTVLVFSGNAGPYLEASQVPVHPMYAFFGLILAVFATAILSGILVGRSFRKTCRSLGLSKEGGGFFGGRPDFAGTMKGRTVRVDTRTERQSTAGQAGSSSTTYTRVSAELDRPLDEGFILVRNQDGAEARAIEDVPDEIRTVPVTDDVAVVGADNEPRAREVVTPRVADSLRGPDAPAAVIVGDPATAIVDAIPDDLASFGSLLGGESIETKLREELGDDAATVSHEFKGLPLDAERLEAKLEAMLTVASTADDAVFGEPPDASVGQE
jgi:hypothetical protein